MHEIDDHDPLSGVDSETAAVAVELYDAAQAGAAPPGVYGGFLSAALLARLKDFALNEVAELAKHFRGRFEYHSGGGRIFGGTPTAE